MSKRRQYTTSWCRIIDDVSKDDEKGIHLPASVLDKFVNNDLSATAQLLYLCLCFNAPADTDAFTYDVDAIADTLQKSTRTIYKALAALKDANLIDIERGIGGILEWIRCGGKTAPDVGC